MWTRARLAPVLGILTVALVACGGGSKTPEGSSTSPAPSATHTAKPIVGGDYTVTATPCVNMRKNPEFGVNILTCVANGSSVHWDGRSSKNGANTWYHVTYKKQSGWIADQYLQRAGVSPSASAT